MMMRSLGQCFRSVHLYLRLKFTYLKQDIYDEYVEYILQRNDNTVKNSLELWNTIDCLEGAQYAQEL